VTEFDIECEIEDHHNKEKLFFKIPSTVTYVQLAIIVAKELGTPYAGLLRLKYRLSNAEGRNKNYTTPVKDDSQVKSMINKIMPFIIPSRTASGRPSKRPKKPVSLIFELNRADEDVTVSHSTSKVSS
jgi:hypothetical protein